MRLSFSTLGCPGWTWERIVDFAASHGFEGLEIRGIQEDMEPDALRVFSRPQAEETRARLAQAGLSICCFGSSVSFKEPEKKEEMLAHAQASIALCRRMGIPAMRVFADLLEGEEPAAGIRRNIEGLTAVAEMADEIQVLLEVHGTFNTLETLTPVLREISRPNFGIVWDIMHSDRAYGDAFDSFYDLIAPRIRHVHIKDYRRAQGAQGLCLMGEGDVPVRRALERLRADGYDGFLSFEWEKRWHPEIEEPETAFPHYAAYMRKLLKETD